MLNKSFVTNFIAVILVIIGHVISSNIILMVGIFALSGALTNWLAIHMLFEKVPFLYGSGVITNRFEDFKIAIKNLIINEFFNKQHIEKFFTDNNVISAENINSKINFDKIFDNLTEAIIQSELGSMLSMFGGKSALDPLKEPVINKLQEIIIDFAQDNSSNSNISDNIITKIGDIIDNRLQELTPKMVKEIISNMIRDHLGWLVIWGGFFGGSIGLIFTVIS